MRKQTTRLLGEPTADLSFTFIALQACFLTLQMGIGDRIYLYSSRDPFTDPEGNSGVRWCGLVWNWCEFDHLPISVDTLPDRVIVLVQLTSAVARHPGVEILALRLR